MVRLISALVIAFALVSHSSVPAAALDKVRVGLFLSASALAHFIALNRGLYQEEGLKIEATSLATHPLIVQSIVSGAIDVAPILVTLEGANINARRPGTLTYISMAGQNAKYVA